ncbi:uncharacterized protein LOC118580056 [Onychomys torridus]|uniref:uncharacterized protein LOC118580056 n=1 Tax=Onychomys torridus TaxID=38674 RepID=UPI00167F9C57|nr:uncharacterized protein LOC118580056 [Onychomys torridus]
MLAGRRNSGIPKTRRARRLRTPHPRPTRLDSARLRALQYPSPLGRGRRARRLHGNAHLRTSPSPPVTRLPGRPASPALPRSPTRTESREGPALSASGNGIGRKATRVPPCARWGTGLDGKPRGSHPALESEGRLGSLLRTCAAPAGFPSSGCIPGCGPGQREQKIRLAASPSLLKQLPARCCGRLAVVQRDVGGSAHARAQPCGWWTSGNSLLRKAADRSPCEEQPSKLQTRFHNTRKYSASCQRTEAISSFIQPGCLGTTMTSMARYPQRYKSGTHMLAVTKAV